MISSLIFFLIAYGGEDFRSDVFNSVKGHRERSLSSLFMSQGI